MIIVRPRRNDHQLPVHVDLPVDPLGHEPIEYYHVGRGPENAAVEPFQHANRNRAWTQQAQRHNLVRIQIHHPVLDRGRMQRGDDERAQRRHGGRGAHQHNIDVAEEGTPDDRLQHKREAAQ